MPFVIRIGYVFIVLSFFMVGMSLIDKSHTIENTAEQSTAAKKAGIGAKIIAVSLLVGIVAAFFVQQFKSLALEAVYVLVAGFILLGLIIIMNNRQKKMNEKAIIIRQGIFKTTPAFNIAAIGVLGLLAMLYAFFW